MMQLDVARYQLKSMERDQSRILHPHRKNIISQRKHAPGLPQHRKSAGRRRRELRRALDRRASGVAEVIPIIVRPADWENTPIAKLQVLPANGIPISSSAADQDLAYLDVVRGLRKVAERVVNSGRL
jgi:hypothetical protein